MTDWEIVCVFCLIDVLLIIIVLIKGKRNEYNNYDGIDSHSIKLDIISKYSGTSYPIGTREKPVNNLDDAKCIGEKYHIDEIELPNGAMINFDIFDSPLIIPTKIIK